MITQIDFNTLIYYIGIGIYQNRDVIIFNALHYMVDVMPDKSLLMS